jgi:hypothetical protein
MSIFKERYQKYNFLPTDLICICLKIEPLSHNLLGDRKNREFCGVQGREADLLFVFNIENKENKYFRL